MFIAFYLFMTTYHKCIGWFYFVSSMFVGVIAATCSFLIRSELSILGLGLLYGDYQLYNTLITSHGLLMIFGFIMPLVLGGISNFFLPILMGVPDMLFSRANNLSFWLYALGCLLLLCGVFIEDGLGIG